MKTPLFPFLGGGVTQSAAIDRLVAQQTPRATTATSVTVAAGGETLLQSTASGNVSDQLPTPAALFVCVIVKTTTDTNKITLVRSGTEKINGVAASFDLPNSANGAADNAWIVISDGTDWFVRACPIHVLSSSTPAALGTAAVGTALTYAHGDHVHANSFNKPYRTDSTTTPTVTSADAAGIVRLSSASNIAITLDATTLVAGFHVRIIKSNSGTNTITAVGTGSSKVYVLDGSPSAATAVNLMNDTSTLRPHWDIISDGSDYFVG